MQEEYFSKAATFVVKEGIDDPNTRLVMDLWGRSLQAIRSQNLQDIGTEIDWVIKKRLMERYMERDSLDWNSPRLAQLDLAYHDINRQRGLFYLLERKGLARRLLNDSEIEVAKTLPPQSTRAKLRGDFISAAQEKKRDFTVDWVHLKLNDQAQRTVLCKDPFLAVDERVDRLIASM
jgi:proteasome accessory factor A